MRDPNEPLEYPAHYPPTDRWKKFFIGVRRLGPDLAFFQDLKGQQAARTADSMCAWSTAARRALAGAFGRAFQEWLRWPTPYFLPGDRLDAIAGGPSFRSVDYGEVEEALLQVERQLEHSVPPAFWQTTNAKTLGELIDQLAEVEKGTTRQ